MVVVGKLKENWFELVCKGNINDWRNGGEKQVKEIENYIWFINEQLV